MSLYKRGHVYWSVIWIDGVRTMRSLETSNRRQAETLEQRLRDELHAKRFQLPNLKPDMRFGELYARFLAEGEVKPHHQDRAKQFLPFFADAHIGQITKNDIMRYRKQRHLEHLRRQNKKKAKPLSETTINRDIEVVRHLLFWAADEGFLPTNPIARICMYKQEHIELTNRGPIVGLKGQYELLAAEERRILDVLQLAPPPGDLRRLRRRAIYYWSITVTLTIAGYFATLLSLAPFRLGWKGWLYSSGVAVLTPFLVEHLLETKSMEKMVKVLTAIAATAAVGGLMLLAVIRGDLLARQIHQDSPPAVVLDDSQPQPETQSTFYDSTLVLLRGALLLIAFSMELGAGLVLREAWRSTPDSSEDWKQLRKELVEVRQRMIEIACYVTVLRNEPGIYAARFWYDFYRAMLSNAVRSAMTKLVVLILGVAIFTGRSARAQNHLDEVIAIDLTRSVATVGSDAKSDFKKNADGVARVLAQASAGSRITVIGITDHSFAQPYILLSARIPDDTGYFGERLAAARNQLNHAWKQRSGHLTPNFQQTDILGALQLTSQIFDQRPDADRRTLIIFSDMRQSTPNLDLETPKIVPSFATISTRCGAIPRLRNAQSYILGADGAGRSSAYWQSLQGFWKDYFQNAGAVLKSYSVLREMPSAAQSFPVEHARRPFGLKFTDI